MLCNNGLLYNSTIMHNLVTWPPTSFTTCTFVNQSVSFVELYRAGHVIIIMIISHQFKTDLKVTEDVLEGSDVRYLKRTTTQLHRAHNGQNELKYSTADQLRLHLQQEGQKLETKTKSNL